MFEREIKFIYDFNLNKVKKTGSFLTYEQLLAADLHPAIMQYISAEIDYLIFEDRQKMLKNSVFDYSGGKITHYFNLISQEVKKSKRFSTEYISKLILHASSFTVNYLIRPKWSLLKFIFDDDEHKTAVEIKQILNYLYYYGYLKNVLISYLDKKKILSMNKDEFSELLDKIEKLGIETYLDDVLNTALKSMAEFFNIGTTQKSKVPLPGIHIFLKEKKLADHINRLNNYFGNDEKINQDIQDVQKVLLTLKTKQNDLFEELSEDEIKDSKTRLDEEIIETPEEEYAEDSPELDEPETTDEIEEEVVDEPENTEIPETENDNEIEIEEVQDGQPNLEENENELETEQDLPELENVKNASEEENPNDIIEDEFIIEEDMKEEVSEVSDIAPETEQEDITEPVEQDIQEESLIMPDEEEENDPENETQSLEEILDEESDAEIHVDNEPEVSEIEEEPITEENELTEEPDINDIIEEQEEELIEEDIQEEIDPENEEISEQVFDDALPEIENAEDDEDVEPSLFGEDETPADEVADSEEIEQLDADPTEQEELSGTTLIDMSEILENKNMTKIIENIFDYDMEDFANTIDLISECPSKAEALALITELFENNNIKPNSKEAETFKSIISEYFDKAQ